MTLRRLFNKPVPAVSRDQAILIARNECEQRSWPWLEPIKVQSKRGTWIIHTNWQARGANARIRVEQDTGAVTEAVFMPR